MRRILCFILFASLILSGCATVVKLTPHAFDSQSVIYNQGKQLIVSPQKNIVAVGIVSGKQILAGKRADFVVIVDNIENQPFHFSTENITARCQTKQLKVYSYEELVAEIESQRKWAIIAAALYAAAGTMQASQAGQQYNYGTYRTNTGQLGTYSGYTYNAAAAQQAQAQVNMQTQQFMDNMNKSYNSNIGDIENKILQKTTIFPGSRHGGVVKIEIPEKTEDQYLNITVESNEDIHNFSFRISEFK